MKIKSGILLSLFSLTLHAANPQLPASITKSIAIPQDLRTHHTFTIDSSNPGPFVIRLETVHTIESPTIDRATNVLEKASNDYFHTPSLLATLGIITVGCLCFECGCKLLQSDKPQKFKNVLAGILMVGGFLTACAPFVAFLLQSRSISV